MERLTQWFGFGDCKVAGIAPHLEGKHTAEELVDKLAACLAAYEDTNLTPEEITAVFNEAALVKLTARYLGIEPDRLYGMARPVGNEVSWGERKAVYEEALKTYGASAQSMVAIEEMSELTKEICKIGRGKHDMEALADEIADVTIMLEQLRLIYGLNEEVCRHMDMKVRRLRRNLGMEQENGDG